MLFKFCSHLISISSGLSFYNFLIYNALMNAKINPNYFSQSFYQKLLSNSRLEEKIDYFILLIALLNEGIIFQGCSELK